MLDTGFLNANLIRSYPFIYNADVDLPDWLIVDFRAVILDGNWDPKLHRVYLAWVALFDDRLRFGFRTDAPDLADQELIFERSLADSAKYITTYAQSQPLVQTLEEHCGCSEELLCNPMFAEPPPGGCGPELLCNPRMDTACGDELLQCTTTSE